MFSLIDVLCQGCGCKMAADTYLMAGNANMCECDNLLTCSLTLLSQIMNGLLFKEAFFGCLNFMSYCQLKKLFYGSRNILQPSTLFSQNTY